MNARTQTEEENGNEQSATEMMWSLLRQALVMTRERIRPVHRDQERTHERYDRVPSENAGNANQSVSCEPLGHKIPVTPTPHAIKIRVTTRQQ